ncbi:hypothetical protein TNCV_1736431 [Trichonephila clavipes]|nr:hypothetical protein TNCV_1736431 [Trichonephila clavipes]
MGLHIGLHYCRDNTAFADLVHFPGPGITFSAAPYRRYQILQTNSRLQYCRDNTAFADLIIEIHLASVGAPWDDPSRTPIARSAPRLFTSTTPG